MIDQQLYSGLLCETHLISPAGLKFQLLIHDVMYCIFCFLLIPVVDDVQKWGQKVFLSAKNKNNIQIPRNVIFTANSINCKIFENQ